ncbi:hypothetical protein FN846DRAFT_774039 [Sphaerosporella brunnea]|uniref:histidine kinase n=1 Tax=Sphaerosporella brunnea TaxID=1250544 RepID=A0A5J5F5S4_9PEZI|nr:hypothetical protein FN846DRAFT_774039 [Sphaerosporella brunnea]
MITRDSAPPTNPMLDWTRKSLAQWVPEHYSDFVSVKWKDTHLGDMSGWSGSLRTIVNSIMAHPYQMVLYWGKEYVTIYNASYADCVRRRHPQLLGQTLHQAWPEAYEKIHEHLQACRRGLSIIRTGDSAPVDRVETDEECYFDWTLTPILEKAGNVGGVLWQQYEGTARILQNRRREMLRSLRKITANSRNTVDFWFAVLEAFDSNTLDSPFVALYEVPKNNDNEAILLGTRGIPQGHSIAPRVIVLAEYTGIFAEEIRKARQSGAKATKRDLLKISSLRLLAQRGFKAPCSTAVVIPIMSTGGVGGDAARMEAFIILGINPRRALDDDYEIWIDQIQDNITEYLGAVRTAEARIEEAMKVQIEDFERRRASELADKLREVEAELRKNELRFTNMASAIPIGLLEMDADCSERFANDAWHKIMGIPRFGPQKKWCDVICAEDRERCTAHLKGSRISGKPASIEYRVISGDEGSKWVTSDIIPRFDDVGDIHGYYATVTDITPLKLAEAMQKERADEALERTRQQERFIDMTCHELRNPLSAILQYSELILDIMDAYENEGSGSLDIDTITEASNTIILCTTHQRRIIDDILVTSKLDSGLVRVEPVDFRPETYLHKSVGMYQADAKAKGVKMSFSVEGSYRELDVQWLKGDPARVMQILSNLITNSIKFTAGQETKQLDVRIGASLEKPTSCGDVKYDKDDDDGSENCVVNGPQWGDGEIVYLTITVIDTGIGIPDDVQKTLFARFQQAPKTETKYGGSGLGLYICKNLVKLLGGSIGVASKTELGAQFSFYVATRRGNRLDKEAEDPGWFAQLTGRMTGSARTSRNASSQAPVKSPPHLLPRAKGPSEVTGFKILVVEDNLINQRVLKRQLESLGCTVWTANNGREAVEFIEKSSLNRRASARAHDIEICFMDCEMPVMNGIAASKKIREMQSSGMLTRHLPILGVSANVRGPKGTSSTML